MGFIASEHERLRRTRVLVARAGVAMILGVVAAGLGGCGATITKHGHHFQDSDLQNVTTGMTGEQVRSALGTPTTTATVGSGTAYYYIGSTKTETSFFKPTEVDRKVMAVYFTQHGAVDKVAQYGLQDGKVFDYAKRETASHARDESILKALFRNLGTKQLGLE
jgi:outer membrane protein assembly factor BamE (lipoprotein component of BamABCDE complex)